MSKTKSDNKSTLPVLNSGNIPQIISVLDKKLQESKKLAESPYKTNGQFRTAGITIDIKNEKEIPVLVEAAASLIMKKEYVAKAQIALELESMPQFTVGGHAVEDLLEDIKRRISIVNQHLLTEKIAKYRDRLSQFVSEEEKKAMLLKEMQDDLLDLTDM